MLSYLKGTVLDWFEPSLTSSESPPWLNDYSDFIRELKNNFGPHDPKGKAEADLENLKMRNNQHIMKYLVDFNCLATCVQWGDAAVCQQMYHGLPSHIKDEITHVGKPDTLHESKLRKDASSCKQSDSTVSSRTSACSAAKLDTSPKSVPRQLLPLPKPALPLPRIRAPTPSLAQSQKIHEQSSTLHTD